MPTRKRITNIFKGFFTRKIKSSENVNIFDGSLFSREFKNICDILSNNENNDMVIAAKPVFIQIAAAFFDDFKPENVKLLKSIQTNLSKGLSNMYEIIPVEKHNKFHMFDLYIALFICGSSFENESLISLITFMANDKEITKEVVKEAQKKCLHGYLPSGLIYRGGISKEKLFHIISLFVIVSNTIWISLNWYHYSVSTSNLFNAIQNGKIAELGDVSLDVFKFVKEMETCKQNARNVRLKKSYTRAAAGLLLNDDSKKMMNVIENAFVCFQSPEVMQNIAEELTFMEGPIEDEEKIIEIEDDVEYRKEAPKIMNKNEIFITSNALITKPYVKEKYLLNDITNEDQLVVGKSEMEHINKETTKLIAILKPTKKMTYKQARAELLSLVEDEDITKLARKLLSDEGFAKFLEESYLREETRKSLDNKIQIQNAPGLIDTAAIILGATYEFFMASPSHTPFYDIIWNIKQKIILFERDIESKITKYRNLFIDVNTEVERFNEQFNSTWERSAKICSDIFLLFGKIVGYLAIGQQIRKYKKQRILEIKDNQKIENGENGENAQSKTRLAITDKETDSKSSSASNASIRSVSQESETKKIESPLNNRKVVDTTGVVHEYDAFDLIASKTKKRKTTKKSKSVFGGKSI